MIFNYAHLSCYQPCHCDIRKIYDQYGDQDDHPSLDDYFRDKFVNNR